MYEQGIYQPVAFYKCRGYINKYLASVWHPLYNSEIREIEIYQPNILHIVDQTVSINYIELFNMLLYSKSFWFLCCFAV